MDIRGVRFAICDAPHPLSNSTSPILAHVPNLNCHITSGDTVIIDRHDIFPSFMRSVVCVSTSIYPSSSDPLHPRLCNLDANECGNLAPFVTIRLIVDHSLEETSPRKLAGVERFVEPEYRVACSGLSLASHTNLHVVVSHQQVIGLCFHLHAKQCLEQT